MSWDLRSLGLFFVFLVVSSASISAASNLDPCTVVTKENYVKHGSYVVDDGYTIAVPSATLEFPDIGSYYIKFMKYVKRTNNEGILQLNLLVSYCYKNFNKLAFEVELAPGEAYWNEPRDQEIAIFYEGPIPGYCKTNLPSNLMQPSSQKLLFDSFMQSFETLSFKKVLSRRTSKTTVPSLTTSTKTSVGSIRPFMLGVPDPFAKNSCYAKIVTAGGPTVPNA
mgnify:CR=1 FL=1